MLRIAIPVLFCVVLFAAARAQVNVPVNGPHDTARPVEAFVHATVHTAPGEALADATLVIQEGRIVAVGTRVKIPVGAVVHDLTGRHVWPALIDAYSDLGMPDDPAKAGSGPDRGAHYWNPCIRASRAASGLYVPDADRARGLREQGFGLVITHVQDGIARGTGAAVLLAGRAAEEDVLVPAVSAHFSFRKGSARTGHPSSLMGAVAVLRQALYDAQWYAAAGRHEQSDADLQALNDQRALPWVFEAANRNDELRAARLSAEFGMPFIVKGNGDEYARLDELKVLGQRLILPLTLPDAFDVEDPFDALEVSVQQMKHWELAPHNAERLHAAGLAFAFTTRGLKNPGDLWANLRRMVRCGLDTATAIAALTTVPARFFGLEDRVGTLSEGHLASFVITTEHLLAAQNRILETWVQGTRHVIAPSVDEDLAGNYDLSLDRRVFAMQVKGTHGDPEVLLSRPDETGAPMKVRMTRQGELVTLVFDGTRSGLPGTVRLNGIVHHNGGIWDGQGQLPDGSWVAWSAVRQQDTPVPPGDHAPNAEEQTLDSLWAAPPGEVWYPFNAFGAPAPPDTTTFLFRHATVWTNGAQGIVGNTDVLVHEGRIAAIGRDLDPAVCFAGKARPSVVEVEARGMHLTSGIIDEHSHIAIERGVNEGGQANTAEVRVGDVVDPDDIDIYRNLAGGVTAVQQLHGSANPIGGQSSLIKLRWGRSAEAMHIAGSAPFIKFALGENVKQSTSENGTRYPRTRMGVEQIMFDGFHRARDYDRQWQAWRSLAKPPARGRHTVPEPAVPAPRRDLELDAMAEILRGERFITCHSYVQAEVLMLMRLADSLGFRVNTFTHILEGYKVADKIRQHGASASTFSDWWAYKFEVYDAIPYNAALLHDAGVNVCINSDDAEMSRRLDQEAAKTMKYGGSSEEEAWKTVTLNPAKALHLDARMGSVEVGKDADLVLWSANPLRIDARCRMTLVDGVPYYDAERDRSLRAAVKAERERLIAKMLVAKRNGAPAKRAEARERGHWTCETLGEEP